MATVNLQVSASGDDVRNISGDSTFNSTAASQALGKSNSIDYWAGWRWLSVAIPQGATITSATLDLYSANVTQGTTALAIFYGNDVDSAAAYANNTANKPEGKTRTTASTAKSFTVSQWTATGFGIDTVNVTSIVQEIVDRAGWASGNNMAIMAHDNGSAGSNSIGFSNYDSNATRGAKLDVTYTTGTLPGDPDDFAVVEDSGTVDMSWTDVANETGYEIQKKIGSSTNWYPLTTPAAGATSYTDTNVYPGYTYTYRIRGTNGDGESDWVEDSVALAGAKGWRAYIEAWLYPGPPAEDADEEYRDGRVIHVLKPEYLRFVPDENDNPSGIIERTNDPADGENAYSVSNAAEVVQYSNEQYATLAGYVTDLTVMLANGTLMSDAIDVIVDTIVDTNFTGVDVDIEGYGITSGWTSIVNDDFLDWIDDLGTALHGVGKKLQICGPPITNSTEQAFYSWDYADFEGRTTVDKLCMMLYDYQFDYGGGESIQPAAWAQAGCAWIRSKISDPDRIVIGMPSYGYHALTGDFVTIDIDTKDESEIRTGYNTAARNSDGEMEWVTGGTSSLYQDSTGLNTKRERLEDEGIKHISVWHLGGNDWFTGKNELVIDDEEPNPNPPAGGHKVMLLMGIG